MKFFEEDRALEFCRSPHRPELPPSARFDVRRYVDASRFERERRRVFAHHPVMALHASELPVDGVVETAVSGQDVRLRRVAESPGVEARNADGQRIAALIRYGFVWLYAGELDDATIDAHLGELLTTDLRAAGTETLRVFAVTSTDWNFNWKLAVEAALESYHFRIAHAKTIGGAFDDQSACLSQSRLHHRAVIPRNGVSAKNKRLRDRAFVTYNVFPNSLFFVNRRHCDWLRVIPLSVNRSRLSIATLVPASVPDTPRAREYFRSNHEFTCEIVREDSAINLSQQKNFAANPEIPVYFGGLEGGLTTFNRCIDAMLELRTP